MKLFSLTPTRFTLFTHMFRVKLHSKPPAEEAVLFASKKNASPYNFDHILKETAKGGRSKNTHLTWNAFQVKPTK